MTDDLPVHVGPDLLEILAEHDGSHATFIGERRDGRLVCGPDHLPGCYNPHSDDTYCICGAVRWPGDVGVWNSAPRYAPEKPAPSLGVGIGAPGLSTPLECLGWDTYYLHAPHCTTRDLPCRPHCAPTEETR